MKVLVIGATGHIGTWLVPRLVRKGHQVVAMSRGRRAPYRPDPAWEQVQMIAIDRKVEDLAGAFGRKVAEVGAEVVIDLILFHPDSVPQLIESLTGRVKHYLYCGTMWVYGPTVVAPTTEDDPRQATDDYGREKAQIEQMLLAQAAAGRLPASVLHPGHIVGPGWLPIGPAGNVNLQVFEKLGRGEEVVLPDHGLATLHHVHADDVAQAMELAVDKPQAAIGQSFNVVSPQAVTLRGFCNAVAGWFGQAARIAYRDWGEWQKHESDYDVEVTWEHIRNCPCGSIEKARRLLGYQPSYSSLAAVRESLAWLIDNGRVDLPRLA
ncbi:MAG TPA: NAD-dependent epimerase/dehydratase family protein [Candidatus Glassbacteria bacterium]|nr:NAD-dependent epimerase/dehydratase family protein [Candidatus Glassbacteria bacterium]